jgi:hypothetical protein
MIFFGLVCSRIFCILQRRFPEFSASARLAARFLLANTPAPRIPVLKQCPVRVAPITRTRANNRRHIQSKRFDPTYSHS